MRFILNSLARFALKETPFQLAHSSKILLTLRRTIDCCRNHLWQALVRVFVVPFEPHDPLGQANHPLRRWF